jgi:hypothetical protein
MKEDPPAPLSESDKREALELALASQSLARSEQLKHFLRFICEMETSGRGSELSEYLIGVEVLGRREGYSASEDPSVRRRAYELRHRLERFYLTERPDLQVRIEIPKGSYVPHFVRSSPSTGPLALKGVLPAGGGWAWLAGAVVVFALGLAAGLVSTSSRSGTSPGSSPQIDPILGEAWGPMASPGASVVICVATNLHLIVRPNAQGLPEQRWDAFPELYGIFRKHRPLPEGLPLHMLVADSSVTFGEVWAAAIASSTLKSFGASYQMLPESVAPLITLQNRNAVVIGVPGNSLVVSSLLSRTPYTLAHDASTGYSVIIKRRSGAGADDKVKFSTGPGFAYGLLTVLPSEGSADGGPRTVIFSGLGSVGAHAAADFFSSPALMRGFKARLEKTGISRFPKAYQIVVKANYSQGLLISAEYAGHAVITEK